jgi:hypothetical protein
VERGRALAAGVGLHTTALSTPRPSLRAAADLQAYQRQIIGGHGAAVDQALLAEPEHLVMGMSLEHILSGLAPIRAVMESVAARSGLGWATWHDAAAQGAGGHRAPRPAELRGRTLSVRGARPRPAWPSRRARSTSRGARGAEVTPGCDLAVQ